MSITKPFDSQIAKPDGAMERDAKAGASGLMRLGFIARGIIYLIPGVLALRLALRSGGGAAITQSGAIGRVGHEPQGGPLLLLLAAGLAGYALWGVVRAILDPLHDGHKTGGVLKRLGYVSSAIAYTGLMVVAVQAFRGVVSHSATPAEWTAKLLSAPFGPWLVGFVGLCWIAGGGITQMVSGWTRSFADDLDLDRLGPGERTLALRMGTIGLIARGFVFTMIGLFLIGAAVRSNSHEALGLDGALLSLVHQPGGRLLLAVVACGLVVFGLFSMLCARWMRVSVPTGHSHSTA